MPQNISRSVFSAASHILTGIFSTKNESFISDTVSISVYAGNSHLRLF